MSFSSHPSYVADTQANITAQVDDTQDGALAFAILEQTAWQLSLTSVAALGSNVIATKSGVGKWLRLAYGSEAAPVSNDYYWPYAVDGVRTENGGGTAVALTGPACYSALTISNNTSLSMASQRLICNGTITVGTGCRLHNDGASATSSTGASGGAPQGQLASSAGPNGASGGSVASNGIAGTAVSPGIGGSGGAGGTGSQPTTGGAGGAVTLPSPASVGLLWTQEFLAFMACISGINFTQVRGGGPGGGGGGSNGTDNRAGGGAGQGGGLAWIRAKNIVVNGTGVISSKGGAGFSPAGPGAGGGGGGGGGFIVIWCDTFTGPAGANDFAGALSVAGGAGGTATGVATNGTAGSTGRIMVFVRGVLAYSVNLLQSGHVPIRPQDGPGRPLLGLAGVHLRRDLPLVQPSAARLRQGRDPRPARDMQGRPGVPRGQGHLRHRRGAGARHPGHRVQAWGLGGVVGGAGPGHPGRPPGQACRVALMSIWDGKMQENPAPPVQIERAKAWARTLREYSDKVIEGQTQYIVAAVEPRRNRTELQTWLGAYQVYMTEMPSVGTFKIPRVGGRRYGGRKDKGLLAGHLAVRVVALELTKRGVSLVGGKTVRAWVFDSKNSAMAFAGMLANVQEQTATLVAGVVRPEFHADDQSWQREMFGSERAVGAREFLNVTGQGELAKVSPGRIILRYWTGPRHEMSRMLMKMWWNARGEWMRRSAYNVYVPLGLFSGKVQPSEPEVILSILENTSEDPEEAKRVAGSMRRLEEDIARGSYGRADDYLEMSVTDAMVGLSDIGNPEFALGGNTGADAPGFANFPGNVAYGNLRT